ncbi:cupredoxin domain-containing protein [Vulgatibacter sp.]|uniref:cupredoxin domain-containing protein n=1 Tax=Vulgatibacter sp. TaxID=1971226 RepID=UPI00356676E6
MQKLVRVALALALALPAVGASLPAEAAEAAAETKARVIDVVVDGGYQPSRIEVGHGEQVVLRFVRKDYSPCAAEVVFPSLGIRKELPVDQPVEIEIPTDKLGEIEFKCGMHMLKGKVVVVHRH